MIALAWAAYDCAMEIAVVLLLGPYELARSIVGRSPSTVVTERLGRSKPSMAAGSGRILIHAVSAGEMVAAKALVEAIVELDADLRILITCGNHEGRQMATSLFGHDHQVEILGYLPWDRRRVLRPWLENLKLAAVVVVETEIWPGLFRAANESGIPLCIVNGRVIPGDVARYRIARRFFADVLGRVRWIGVENQDEMQRFIEIGALIDRITVVGALKADGTLCDQFLPPSWQTVFDDLRDPIVVAGSTHSHEHQWMLWVYRELLAEHPGLRLIIAPRHPKRAPNIEAAARRAALETRRWSQEPSSAWQVLVVDRMGVLPLLYGKAQVAIVGGSMVRRGGHNPLEPCRPGVATVIGPYCWAYERIVGRLVDAGGAILLPQNNRPKQDLLEALRSLLGNDQRRKAMGAAAKSFYREHQGSAGLTAKRLLDEIGTT